MKKNVILLVIDSVYEKSTYTNSYKMTPMPFLNELRKKSFQATKMYSQAPFTEAAVMPLITGNNLLEEGGYLTKFEYRKTAMNYFKENGYNTYLNHYLPLIYPSHVWNGLTEKKYAEFYVFSQLWSYRLNWYSSIYEKKGLDAEEFNFLIKFVEDNFITAIDILNKWIDKDKEVEILRKYSKIEDPIKELKKVKQEYSLFLYDKLTYVKEILEQKLEHSFFKQSTFSLNKKCDEEHVEKFINRYHSTFDRIYKLNKQRNIRNLKLPLTRMIKHFSNKEVYEAKQLLAMYKNAIFDKDLYDRVSNDFPNFKAAISMRGYINDGLNWIDEQDSSEKPFMLYLHVDDAHAPELFYSIEESDFNVLDQEFKALNEYMDKLPSNYYGNLAGDLSLVYCDLCLKYLFEQLEKRNLLDNTIIAITADHGYSYSYRPLRTNYVNNEHFENYHIPFVLYDQKQEGNIKNSYFSTTDIVPTLLQSAGLEIPKNITGVDMINNVGRDHAIIEYMGGGCPDMKNRDMILGVRTDDYLVIMKLNVFDTFSFSKLDQVYDLKKDPQELKNLKNKISQKHIEKEMNLIQNRFLEIQKEYMENNCHEN